MSIEWIFIICLAIVCVSLMVYEVIMSKKHEEELGDADEEINMLIDKYSAAQKTILELNSNFASSIDVHSKAYDDILVRCKKLEIELSEKEAEIIKLQARLYSFNGTIDIDTSKGPSDLEGDVG
jgi:hypothetical protein